MTLTFADAVRLIDGARSFADLRRSIPGDAYRVLVKLVHPDTVDPSRKGPATTAFVKLSQLHDGQFRKAYEGDIADLLTDRDGRLVKVPRSPGDNDLMEAEAEALRRLQDSGDPTFRPYAPRLLDSYLHEDGDRKRRRVNVLERLDGFIPLSSLNRIIDWRDAAWMWRRLLAGLGWAHRAGVIHGAVLEEHVLIHPAEHGLAIVDWCYSGSRPKAIVKHRRHAYPPEISKKTATPATDIYMATGLMTRLIGPGIPGQLRRFAAGCMYDAPRMRPQDAWQLLGELDDLLGPRTFRPFTL